MKNNKWMQVVIFYLLTCLLMAGSVFVAINHMTTLAYFCFLITGAVATIPIHKSYSAAKQSADKWMKRVDESNWEIGKLRLDDFMENPVIYRQPEAV